MFWNWIKSSCASINFNLYLSKIIFQFSLRKLITFLSLLKHQRKSNPLSRWNKWVSSWSSFVAGRQEALDWLKESLSDAIEDFEDYDDGGGQDEGIPLVPIMDYAQEAMGNGEFQEMLKAFGICEPFDEQVSNWDRIILF